MPMKTMGDMKEMERSLGLFPVVAISLSAMLGIGVFVVPGLAAELTGPTVWLAFLLAGLAIIPGAAAKSELAAAMPTSGGIFVYLDRAFGPWVGTITGAAVWLAGVFKASFALIGVSVYLVAVADVPAQSTAFGLLAVIVLLNWIGVQAVSRAQIFVMAAVLIFLVAMCGLSVAHWDTSQTALGQADKLPGGAVGLAAATGLVVVAYDGAIKIAAIAEEVRNPARNVTWGIFISMAIAAGFYALVAFMLAGTLTTEQFVGNPRPIVTWAQHVGGEAGAAVAAIFGVVVLASLANTGLLAASRFPFAMSRDHLLPFVLQKLSARFRTPAPSIAVTAAGMALAISVLNVEKLAKLASAVIIGLYTVSNFAVILFRESGVGWYRPKFKVPLYPWLPAIGVLSGSGLLFQFGMVAVWGWLLAFALGTIVFLTYGRRRVTRRGVIFQRGRRTELIQQSREQVGRATTPASRSSTPIPPSSTSRSPVSSLSLSGQEMDIEDAITGRARAVVAMFGDERGPETLVEIGTALSGHGKLPVMHLTEVPEQTILGALDDDAPAFLSLRRRLRVMAEEEGTSIEFHSVHSRDIVRTVHAVTSRVQCDFLVMRWRGRSRWALMPYNPLGWLVDHLDCNLALFRDAGVRYIREIMIFAEPGPHDALVVGTADDLARRWGARITLVRPITKEASQQKRQTETEYLRELSELCEAPTRVALVEGSDITSTLIKESSLYDLVVMGSPQDGLMARLRGNPIERVARKAACSVLMLKTPRVRTHEAYAKKREHEPTQLFHFVHERAVENRIAVARKDALFEHVAEVFAELLEVPEKEILDALWARERTQNTSVGHGVALPHATLDAVSSTIVGVFTLAEPINYHGPDGEKVSVVFVIVSPPGDRQRHLELLSTIARLALSSSMLTDLREASSKEQMLRSIDSAEQSQSTIRSARVVGERA